MGTSERRFSPHGRPCHQKLDGSQQWWYNGVLHRTDGPASLRADGTKEWWQHGMRHREDGPAIVYAEGGEEWWQNDVLHRTDGPAINRPSDPFPMWYVNGYLVDMEERQLGALENERTKYHLRSKDLDEKAFFGTFSFVSTHNFVYVKDHVDVTLLTHENACFSAVSAWHLPVDDDYVAAALEQPFVREIMQYRTDVPEHIRTLMEVAG